jgi:hypothetical protein
MMSAAYLDSLIAYEDMQRAGYPLDAEDALAAWAQGETDDPAWYMNLALEVRREIAMVIHSCASDSSEYRWRGPGRRPSGRA